MGNCIRHQQCSSTNSNYSDYDDKYYWDEEDVDKSFAARSKEKSKIGGTKTEVKIKITKKQLAELLGKVNVDELRLQQVLAQLVAQTGAAYDHSSSQLLHRPWRPVLQTIPELN